MQQCKRTARLALPAISTDYVEHCFWWTSLAISTDYIELCLWWPPLAMITACKCSKFLKYYFSSRSFHSCPSRGSHGSPSHHSSSNEDPHPVSGIPERISEEDEHDENDPDVPVDFSKPDASKSGNVDSKDKMKTISILGDFFSNVRCFCSKVWVCSNVRFSKKISLEQPIKCIESSARSDLAPFRPSELALR